MIGCLVQWSGRSNSYICMLSLKKNQNPSWAQKDKTILICMHNETMLGGESTEPAEYKWIHLFASICIATSKCLALKHAWNETRKRRKRNNIWTESDKSRQINAISTWKSFPSDVRFEFQFFFICLGRKCNDFFKGINVSSMAWLLHLKTSFRWMLKKKESIGRTVHSHKHQQCIRSWGLEFRMINKRHC